MKVLSNFNDLTFSRSVIGKGHDKFILIGLEQAINVSKYEENSFLIIKKVCQLIICQKASKTLKVKATFELRSNSVGFT
jgi:hypothetical protein